MMNFLIALPCIAFSLKEREIIRKYGFLTYPEFIDNFYVRHRTRKYNLFVKLLDKYYEQIRFAVLPDFHYDLMKKLINEYDSIEWIFPLHKKSEMRIVQELNIQWIGFPHRKHFRNYSLTWFLRETKNCKRWYLGFWLEKNPYILLLFHGFDTTIPETYSGKFGKIWITWNKAIKPPFPMKTIQIFEINVKNFKNACKIFLRETKCKTENFRRAC